MKSVFKSIARENFLRSGYIMGSERCRRLPWGSSMPSSSPLELSGVIGYTLRHKGNRMTDPLWEKSFNLNALINAFIRRRD